MCQPEKILLSKLDKGRSMRAPRDEHKLHKGKYLLDEGASDECNLQSFFYSDLREMFFNNNFILFTLGISSNFMDYLT